MALSERAKWHGESAQAAKGGSGRSVLRYRPRICFGPDIANRYVGFPPREVCHFAHSPRGPCFGHFLAPLSEQVGFLNLSRAGSSRGQSSLFSMHQQSSIGGRWCPGGAGLAPRRVPLAFDSCACSSCSYGIRGCPQEIVEANTGAERLGGAAAEATTAPHSCRAFPGQRLRVLLVHRPLRNLGFGAQEGDLTWESSDLNIDKTPDAENACP